MDIIDYEIIDEPKLTLLELKNSEDLVLKEHKFRIIFDSNPSEVLKYGPNALHFFEHIFYGIVSKAMKTKEGNASTFATGSMDYYFVGESKDIETNINAFFEGLNNGITYDTYNNIKEEMRIEQKRVMSEIKHNINKQLASSITMFKLNPEIYRGEFNPNYLWNILIGYCQVVKICLVAHHKLTNSQKDLFISQGKSFLSKWKKFNKSHLKPVEIPYYNIFPLSEFQPKELTLNPMQYTGMHSGDPSYRDGLEREFKEAKITKKELLNIVSPTVSLNLNDIENGIVRYLLSAGDGDLLFGKIDYPREYLFDILKETLKINIDVTADQFRYADILVASTKKITPDDIKNITTKTRMELFKLYKNEVKNILQKYTDETFNKLDKYISNGERELKFGRKKTRFFDKKESADKKLKYNEVDFKTAENLTENPAEKPAEKPTEKPEFSDIEITESDIEF